MGIEEDTDGKSVIVVAVVKDGDNVVKSEKTTIKVSKSAAAEFAGSYVYDSDELALTTEDFNKLEDEDKVNHVYEKDKGEDAKKLALYYVDQYGGEELGAFTKFNENKKPTLENLTPTTVIVDNNGKIKPISVGEGYVRVTQGDIVQTIKIEVKKDSAIETMEVVKEASVVSGQETELELTFRDQYGEKQDVTTGVTVESSDDEIVKATTDNEKVTIEGVKEGSTTVTVEYKEGDTTLKETIDVTVVKAGELAEYKAKAQATKLDAGNVEEDQEGFDKKKAPKSTNVVVNKVDTNGNNIGTVESSNVTLKEVDKDGKDINDKALLDINEEENTLTAKDDKAGTAYVEVSVGKLVIDTIEVEVVNTKPTATSVSFDRFDLLIDKGFTVAEDGTVTLHDEEDDADLDKQLKTIIKVLDQDGNEIKEEDAPALEIDFTATNANGIEISEDNDQKKITKITKASPTVDLVVTSVKAGEKELLEAAETVKLNVKVADQKGNATISNIVEREKNTETTEDGELKYPTDIGGIQVKDLNFNVNENEAVDLKIGDLDSLEVSLYNENTHLVTNTFAPNRADNSTLEGTKINTVSFNYNSEGINQWAWDRGAYPVELDGDEEVKVTSKPTKVVMKYVVNGITYEVEKRDIEL